MRRSGSLHAALLLATPAIRGRGITVGLLALAERLLTPAVAWALFGRSTGWKTGLALVLAAAFTFRSFMHRRAVAAAEAEITARVTAAVLNGDVLRASVLRNDDARAELGQGVYYAAVHLAQELPMLGADIASACVLAVAISIVEPPRLLVVAVILGLTAGGALAWSRSKVQRASAAAWRLQEPVIAQLVDALEGRLEIVASGTRSTFVAEALERTRAWGAASAQVAGASLLSGRLPLLGIAVVVALAVGFGAQELGAVPATLADLALFASVTPAFTGIAQGLQSTVRAESWLRIVTEVVRGARPVVGGVAALPPLPASIALENVSFHYGDDAKNGTALKGVSFAWKSEPVFALSGANGSGKSTCLRLLLALSSPTQGRLMVGDTELAHLDADAWRARIAFLPQKPYLPPRADVRSAIRLLAPNASDEVMRRALDRVGLSNALRRMGPELDVRVDSLSVGQRQRVALARVLCREASLWVLDEPDANLDQDGIALVVDLVRELGGNGGRVILAAHSPELLALASQTVNLEEGRVSAG
jgi:ABC-type multidrug transport system fused ATPase/permease subunit